MEKKKYTQKEVKKAYTDILGVCNKYADMSEEYRDIKEMIESALNRLEVIKWSEEYGLELDGYAKPHSYNYIEIDSYRRISFFNDAMKDKRNGCGKYISWSDDGRQPKEEWLLVIGFSTGAYIFGDDYNGQQQLFEDFFRELVAYKPDYSDTVNKMLYWKLENAKAIYDDFGKILQKYAERNKDEFNSRKIAKLKEELKALEDKGSKSKLLK